MKRLRQAWAALCGRDYERELDDLSVRCGAAESELDNLWALINSELVQMLEITTDVQPIGTAHGLEVEASIQSTLVRVPSALVDRSQVRRVTRRFSSEIGSQAYQHGFAKEVVRDYVAMMGRQIGQDYADIHLREFVLQIEEALG